jgi:predicted porin
VAHYELRNQYNSNLLVARANYFLSRRTTLYTSVGYMLNGRLAAEPVAVGGSVETGMNQVGVMLGIQQRF